MQQCGQMPVARPLYACRERLPHAASKIIRQGLGSGTCFRVSEANAATESTGRRPSGSPSSSSSVQLLAASFPDIDAFVVSCRLIESRLWTLRTPPPGSIYFQMARGRRPRTGLVASPVPPERGIFASPRGKASRHSCIVLRLPSCVMVVLTTNHLTRSPQDRSPDPCQIIQGAAAVDGGLSESPSGKAFESQRQRDVSCRQ